MARWLAALALGLFLIGYSVTAFAGVEGGDLPSGGNVSREGNHSGNDGGSVANHNR